ncbi:MAG TPA: hypothetical protein VLG36_01940 [Candidatus Chromulinivoraceae bacterium]|nr:hypothetical protein [Candidatus Chromulinivoraceae bacterium]
MKIHLVTSKPTLENDIDVLRKIMQVIKQEGHVLARDWVDGAFNANQKTGQTAEDWSNIYNESISAIAQADVVIAEASYENFAIGYQVAVAVQQKKPILLLRRASMDKSAFATGIEDGWVKHEEYEEATLDKIIQRFIGENDISTKDMRFNFFIDRPIYNYLRWAALKTGKTKAEILRSLVQQEIEKKDL